MQPSAVASSHYNNSRTRRWSIAVSSIAIHLIQILKHLRNICIEILIFSSVSAIYTIKLPYAHIKTLHTAFSLLKNLDLSLVSIGIKGTTGPHQESEAS